MKRLTLVLLAVGLAAAATACGDEGNVFTLDVGDCFNTEGLGVEVQDVPIVDCSEPHDAEVYHLFDLEDGDYPGDAAIDDAAETGCIAEFQGYVGLDYQSSSLFASWLAPTADGWDAGDQEIVCVLISGDGSRLSGSQRGAAV